MHQLSPNPQNFPSQTLSMPKIQLHIMRIKNVVRETSFHKILKPFQLFSNFIDLNNFFWPICNMRKPIEQHPNGHNLAVVENIHLH